MTKLFLKDILIQPHVFLLGVIALFPLYKISFTSYPIFIFVIYGLINSLKSSSKRKMLVMQFKDKRKIFVLCSLIIYVLVISLIYTENINIGIKSIQHSITLLIFSCYDIFFHKKNI